MTTNVVETAPPLEQMERSRSIRILLHQRPSKLSSFGSFRTTCISKHYALNNQILAAFDTNYQSQLWGVAYHFGLKFVESALLEIPKHGYFYADKFSELRTQSTNDALRVCRSLRHIIEKDPTELDNDTPKINLLHGLAIEQSKRLPSYEEARTTTKREIARLYPNDSKHHHYQDNNDESTSSFASTLLVACGDTFSSVFCPGAANKNTSQEEYPMNFVDDVSAASGDTAKQQPRLYPSFSSEARQPDDSSTWLYSRKSMDSSRDDRSSTSLFDQAEGAMSKELSRCNKFPPYVMEQQVAKGTSSSEIGEPYCSIEPPSHNRTQSDYDLQRALFISGLQVELEDDVSYFSSVGEQESSSGKPHFAPPGALQRASGPSLEVLSSCYHEDFDMLRRRGRISVRQLPTYQGRVPGSINGCTVIAPLLCIHHFVSENSIPDRGLPDEAIVQAIDEETPNILPKIRADLGLVKNAFLIPADAHDALMQQNYMCHEQFLNVCGGNILDEAHLVSFIGELGAVGPKKLAATFFFHEHVITILQLRHDSKSAWFELIDSLPHEDTFLQVGEASTASLTRSARTEETTPTGRGCRQPSLILGSDRTLSSGEFPYNDVLVDHVPPPDAVRIRCMDVESLKVTLMWYACSVFSDDNRAYIDAYEWDEKLADFDPRVFQAYIWTEAS
jgi:hypothetical protein